MFHFLQKIWILAWKYHRSWYAKTQKGKQNEMSHKILAKSPKIKAPLGCSKFYFCFSYYFCFPSHPPEKNKVSPTETIQILQLMSPQTYYPKNIFFLFLIRGRPKTYPPWMGNKNKKLERP